MQILPANCNHFAEEFVAPLDQTLAFLACSMKRVFQSGMQGGFDLVQVRRRRLRTQSCSLLFGLRVQRAHRLQIGRRTLLDPVCAPLVLQYKQVL
ncbi:hypothetical protein [Xanthomonas oryzae]|uniref:hypothetical protein n=1 Tax=Xanthomonas oryzae TaxID=347 RepID=UPI0030FE0787